VALRFVSVRRGIRGVGNYKQSEKPEDGHQAPSSRVVVGLVTLPLMSDQIWFIERTQPLSRLPLRSSSGRIPGNEIQVPGTQCSVRIVIWVHEL
jgi:hypothetical protein